MSDKTKHSTLSVRKYGGPSSMEINQYGGSLIYLLYININ